MRTNNHNKYMLEIRVSQVQQGYHFVLNNSFLWRLTCALLHPLDAGSNTHSPHHNNYHKCLQTLAKVSWGQNHPWFLSGAVNLPFCIFAISTINSYWNNKILGWFSKLIHNIVDQSICYSNWIYCLPPDICWRHN